MSIYLELLERVSNGESFHINFEKRNMKARIKGMGTVKKQSIAAGSKVKRGKVIFLELE